MMSDRIVTVPNVISGLRLALVPVFGYLLFGGYYYSAVLALGLAGFSDWLDGKLARYFNQISRLGQLLDPAADRLYIMVCLLGLAYRGFIPVWLMVVIIARDGVMAIFLLVLRHYRVGPPGVHMAGKAATFVLMYAFPLLLLATLPGGVGMAAHVFGWACALWGVGLYWFGALVYITDGIARIRRGK